MLKNDGYILLESVLSLAILVGLVYGYLAFSLHLQQQSQRQIKQLDQYALLHRETKRFTRHQEINAPSVTITVNTEKVAAVWSEGAQQIEVAKK